MEGVKHLAEVFDKRGNGFSLLPFNTTNKKTKFHEKRNRDDRPGIVLVSACQRAIDIYFLATNTICSLSTLNTCSSV